MKKTLLYCNYWVGSHSFWEQYIAFLKHLFNTILTMPPQERNAYFSNTLYFNRNEPFFPFIFERLFSTYIRWNKKIKALNYPYILQEVYRTRMAPIEQKMFSSTHTLFEKYEHSNPDFIRELVTQWRSFMFGLQPEQ